MADTTFTVLNYTGATVTFRGQDIGLATAVLVMMSVPSTPLGTAMIGQAAMASSIPVVIASNQASLTAVVSGTVTANLANPITAVVSGTVTTVVSNASIPVNIGSAATLFTVVSTS